MTIIATSLVKGRVSVILVGTRLYAYRNEIFLLSKFVDAFGKAHERMRLARENVIQNLQELSLESRMTVLSDNNM